MLCADGETEGLPIETEEGKEVAGARSRGQHLTCNVCCCTGVHLLQVSELRMMQKMEPESREDQ